MRMIESTPLFRRDFKRLRHSKDLELVDEIICLLANDKELPSSVRDHALKGELAGYRECHIKPDMLLIYEKVEDILRLARIGSHSHLFG